MFMEPARAETLSGHGHMLGYGNPQEPLSFLRASAITATAPRAIATPTTAPITQTHQATDEADSGSPGISAPGVAVGPAVAGGTIVISPPGKTITACPSPGSAVTLTGAPGASGEVWGLKLGLAVMSLHLRLPRCGCRGWGGSR